MTPDQLDQAAGLLVHARTTGTRFPELPDGCKPRNAAEANAIVAEVTRRLQPPIGGWKITFLYKPREVPLIAPLFAHTIFQSPAIVSPSITHSLLIEPEICFRLLVDLPPRQRHYPPSEVMEAVVACPSLELNDTRYDTRHRSIRQILDNRSTILEAHADHQTSGAFVVGEGRPDWRDFDFAAQRVVMTCGDEVLVDRIGGHALSDPFLPVVTLANERRRSTGLKAGEVVATGSFSGFFAVRPDQPVTVDFVGFGSATATFASNAA